MSRILLAATLVLGFIGLLDGGARAGAAGAGATAAIVGVWVFEAGGTSVTLALGGDGGGRFNEVPLTWRYAGTTLTIALGGQEVSYQAVVRGDALELSGGDLAAPVTFGRQGGARGASPAAPPGPPAAPAAPAGGLIGTWAYTSGATTVLLELGADGAGKFNGVDFRWQAQGSTLVITAAGGQAMSYQITLRGNQLDVAGGDLPAPVTLARQGGSPAPAARPGAAPARGATGIVGTWIYANGQTRYVLELGADGTGKFNGGPLRWVYAGTTLTITSAAGQAMGYQAVLRGDSLDVSGGDLPGPATLQRQGTEAAAAAPSAGGLAGVYSSTESSVDGSIALVYTQYVTLYPDGTVGYQKTEGGASNTQLTQNWARFRSWHQGGPAAGNAGRWESDGSSIVVRWRYWNNLVSRGRVDAASGRFELSGMGVLQEGRTLVFKRE